MRPSLRCLLASATMAAPSLCAQPTPAPRPTSASRTVSAPRPTYPAPGHSLTVPFAVPVDFTNLAATLKLLAAVDGGPAHAFTIDTGSVGVVLPAAEIPDFNPDAPGNTKGELRYSSSGLTLDGFWTTATVRFLNPATQQPLAQATVQVLAVTQGSCQGGGANSGACTGNIPHMLGVGFGRGGDAANGMQTQANNPFVNLAAMNALHPLPSAHMRHGYLITHAGITFGLTDPETRGFTFVKLTPAAPGAPPVTASPSRVGSVPIASSAPTFSQDYNTAPGFLTLGTLDFPMGTALIDSGLTNMIVEEPNEPASGDLPAGKPVTVHLLGDQLRYRFTTGSGTQGQTSPVAPRRATWAAYSHGPFINTGLRALACLDYLYDADNGYLGLRPTCLQPGQPQ